MPCGGQLAASTRAASRMPQTNAPEDTDHSRQSTREHQEIWASEETHGLTQWHSSMCNIDEFWNFFNNEAAAKLALREKTFRKIFEFLDLLDGPITIVETGG